MVFYFILDSSTVLNEVNVKIVYWYKITTEDGFEISSKACGDYLYDGYFWEIISRNKIITKAWMVQN